MIRLFRSIYFGGFIISWAQEQIIEKKMDQGFQLLNIGKEGKGRYISISALWF